MTDARHNQPKGHPKAVPALDLTGPLKTALIAVAALGVLFATSAIVEVDVGPMATATGTTRADVIVIRHADGGTIANVYASAGSTVQVGQLLVSFDTRSIDSQIAGLKTQAGAITMRLAGLRQETEALAAMDRQAAQRGRLTGLQAQMADIEQEGLGIQVRIAMAEQERKRTDVRAPVAGQVLALTLPAAGVTLGPQAPLATIRPAIDRMLLETHWPVATANGVKAGHAVRVWPARGMVAAPAMAGMVTTTNHDDTEGNRTLAPGLQKLRVAVDLTGTDLDQSLAAQTDARFDVQLIMGRRTLLAHLFSPLDRASAVATPSVLGVTQ